MRHRPRLPAILAFIASLLGAAHAASASAQEPLRADVAAQLLIRANAGVQDGCGLRLFAVYLATNAWIVAVDTSAVVYADGTGAFQGDVSEFAVPARGRDPTPAPVAIESIWVKSPESDATRPVLGKVDKGEDGHTLLYAVESDSAIAVMLSALKEEAILFGFRRSGNPAEQIYIGAPKLSGAEIEQLQRCLVNLAK